MEQEIKIINKIYFSWQFPGKLSLLNSLAYMFLPISKIQEMTRAAAKEAYHQEIERSKAQILEERILASAEVKSKSIN